MKKVVVGLVTFLVFLLFGCYHVTVETGLKPSTETIEKPFASCWFYGLIPPNTIQTAQRCPYGVAKVETQISLVNYIVGALTFYIYTPVNVRITCAEKLVLELETFKPDIILAEDATSEEISKAFENAAEKSIRSGKPVYVKFN